MIVYIPSPIISLLYPYYHIISLFLSLSYPCSIPVLWLLLFPSPWLLQLLEIFLLEVPPCLRCYPLVNVYMLRTGKSPCLMGKSTNCLWPCSIANCLFTRPGYPIFSCSKMDQSFLSRSLGEFCGGNTAKSAGIIPCASLLFFQRLPSEAS